jgi:phospholipase/carboxylesterase
MSEPFNTRLVSDGPAGLVHRVREPQTPGPHRTVVMLHGRSGDENVMWVFARALPAHWLVVAPRAITPDPDGGYAWHPRKPNEWPVIEMFDHAVESITRFIHALPALYHADLNHIYLMGFSQGAAASYATTLKYPGWVKGIAGLVGFLPLGVDVSAQPLAGLPVFMAVGRSDPTIPLAVAQACAQTLRAVGAALDERLYDTGHKLNADGMRDLKAWWAEREF